MAEAVPAVALLFDDAGLGEQLRAALQERGARIVHEGPLKDLSRQLLSSVDADVLVVNLDDEDDSALDRLDETLDGERPRVVFNDAQASRRLEGWDRARWARHLAMKVLAMGDADPPRPPAPAESAVQAAVATPPTAEAAVPDTGAPALEEVPAIDEEARQAAASETLAAELEALLASDAPEGEGDEFGSGLNYSAGEGVALHDGTFETAVPVDADASETADEPARDVQAAEAPEVSEPIGSAGLQLEAIVEPGEAVEAVAPAPAEPAAPAYQLDHLELAPVGAEDATAAVRAATEPAAFESRLSDSWSLVDDDAPAAPAPEAAAAAPVERADPADFGIEKVSAADYLAPDAGDDESPILPGLSLELVSLEEAIAPQDYEPSHEMMLDMPTSLLPRVVVLGATTESTASVGEFLAALPAGLRATVLHTQHLAGRPADGLAEYLSSQCALPVRLAAPGLRARIGEVIVVPSDRHIRLRRDGSLQLQPIEAGAAHAPSIDASFSLAAEAFGGDVVAIVFAGRSTDAVAGCQAVRDAGGEVWVEAGGSGHPADMVSGVLAENLSHHAGTPAELAARLAEQFTEGQP
jgi:two-component system chemotaxis response regulator CheB/chemosensory pili system protein ChpB (putative protein-glutamate methylesterase)